MLGALDGWAWLCERHERNATCSMGGHGRMKGMSKMRHARRTELRAWLYEGHERNATCSTHRMAGWAWLCEGHEPNATCSTHWIGGHGFVKGMSEMRHAQWAGMNV